MDLINRENELVKLVGKIFFQTFVDTMKIVHGKPALQAAWRAILYLNRPGVKNAYQLFALENKGQAVQRTGVIYTTLIIEIEDIGFEGSFFFQFEIADKGFHIGGTAAGMLFR